MKRTRAIAVRGRRPGARAPGGRAGVASRRHKLVIIAGAARRERRVPRERAMASEDLVSLVTTALEARGTLGKLRAQLRASVFSAIYEQNLR